MSQQQSPWRRCGKGALAAVTGLGLVITPTVAHAVTEAPGTTWEASVATLETGVKSGYQLVAANGSIYVADAQWRVDGKVIGTPESTPLESGTSMRTTFSPYGIAVDPDVNGEAVVVTTTARQTAAAASGGTYNFGGGVVVYSASQGAPTDADRVYEYADGSPVFSGPRRVAVDTERNLAYVTNLGTSRGASDREGYITVLDLTKRGIASVVAQVTVPNAAGSVGVAVDEVNNLVYVGGYADQGTSGAADVETLYVIDGNAIDTSDPDNFALNNGAISALDAVVGGNARPTFNAETQKVYVSAYDLSTITVVDADPASDTYGEAEKVIEVTTGSAAANTGTNAVEVDAARGLLYSANLDAGVTVYDIENGYEQVEFTDAEGASYSDIPTSGRAVNFGLNEATGEMWVSMWGSTGTVDILNLGYESPQTGTETVTVTAANDANSPQATITYPTEWVEGEPLVVTGENWTSKSNDGARVALKLDRGNTFPKVYGTEPEDHPDGVWQVFDANSDGTFSIEIDPFPTEENSYRVQGASAPALWEAGTTHAISFLSGSLGLDTPHESGARGATGNVSIVAQSDDEAEGVWRADVESRETGVKNGYQLTLEGGTVYVPDAQWTTNTAVGTGKVVLLDAASKQVVANHDYTGLRRNDGLVQATGTTTTEPSGKVVVFDQGTKAQTAVHSFLGLSRNDGSGAEGEPFTWSSADTANSKTSMRTTFSPYGIAVDPDVNGEAVVVTTTARQTAAAASGGTYNFGGGVVVYSASQGAPTDADRVYEYADGSPVFSGPRRVAVDTERNLAYVTNLGTSRGASDREGYITVLDLTKRGIASVVAQVTVPNAAGSVGVAVDEVNNLVYVGGYADQGTSGAADVETLYVIDGNAIDTSDPDNFALNNGAISALDAVVGGNARPTFNAETQKVYVSAYDLSTITVVDADPASDTYGEAEKVIEVTTGSAAANTGTNAVEVDAARGLLYSANLDAGVTVYDIENGYEQVEFTDAEGASYSDIPTSGRAVNFGLNEATGEMWVSMWGSTGTVDVISVDEKSAPVFTTQPAAQEVAAGETATFQVVVAGSPAPALQWQSRIGLGASWSDIAGATGGTLEVPATRELDGAQYRVVAVNEHGEQTSAEVALSVNYAPVVTSSPLTQAVQAGETATFTASAQGKPAATVVWQKQAPGETEWSTLLGATSETLEVSNVTVEQRGTLYRAVFSNELGDAATQSAALAVNAVKPAPLDESVWRGFVPGTTEELLEQPAGGLVGQQTGTTVTISNLPVADGDWVEVFGYSQPQYLGSFLVANNGQITVNVAAFGEGIHHLAVYDTSNTLLGYVSFVINPDGSGAVIDTPTGTQVLTTTGSDSTMPLMLGAGALLLLGAGAFGAAAYRRRVGAES